MLLPRSAIGGRGLLQEHVEMADLFVLVELEDTQGIDDELGVVDLMALLDVEVHAVRQLVDAAHSGLEGLGVLRPPVHHLGVPSEILDVEEWTDPFEPVDGDERAHRRHPVFGCLGGGHQSLYGVLVFEDLLRQRPVLVHCSLSFWWVSVMAWRGHAATAARTSSQCCSSGCASVTVTTSSSPRSNTSGDSSVQMPCPSHRRGSTWTVTRSVTCRSRR